MLNSTQYPIGLVSAIAGFSTELWLKINTYKCYIESLEAISAYSGYSPLEIAVVHSVLRDEQFE